jgi:3-phenylpropionate/trans-cinnamate dioxygenase ferredoxin subunit
LEDDVLEFVHHGSNYSIYRLAEGVFASQGYCTHEKASLADGLVIDGVIECPLHQGRFDIRTGRPLGGPVCEALRTYPARQEGGVVLIGLPIA